MIKYLYENKKVFSGNLEKLDSWEFGKIKPVLKGSNQVFLLELHNPNFDSSILSVYKPKSGERPLFDFPPQSLYKREASAFVISKILGWPQIPSTTIRNGPFGVGTLQKFIKHDPTQNYFTLRESYMEELECFAVFDLLINNADRKGSSCIQDSTKKIWSLDHGLTFSQNSRLRTVMFEFNGRKISDNLNEDLIMLKSHLSSDIDLKDLLIDWLTEESFEFFNHRLESIIEFPKFPYLDVNINVPWPLI